MNKYKIMYITVLRHVWTDLSSCPLYTVEQATFCVMVNFLVCLCISSSSLGNISSVFDLLGKPPLFCLDLTTPVKPGGTYHA